MSYHYRLIGYHGSAASGREGQDCRTGGEFQAGKEQAGCRGRQVGRQRKRHHRAGQADVYDHDGDDGLHQVHPSTCQQ